MTYTTIDYLPDLTSNEMNGARNLSFTSYLNNNVAWDNRANVSGSEKYALLHDTYRFNAIAGATYDLFSTSFFDPFLLRIYDGSGNTIVVNNENDDGSDIFLGDGYYSQDIIYNWVAPYTGTYYVGASWDQGSYYTYYSLSIYEDVNTIPVTIQYPSYLLATNGSSVNEGSSITYTLTTTNVAAGIVVPYIISGVSAADISGGALTGLITVDVSGRATFSVALVSDQATEGIEIMVVKIGNTSTGTLATASDVAINDTSTAVNSINQTLLGTPSNDFFTGGTGNDTINGAAGIDTSIYVGNRSSFTVNKTITGFFLTDTVGVEGADSLTNIERLQFADKKIALDLAPTEHGGQALEFIGLLAPALINSPSVVGLILNLFDSGSSMLDVCQLALDVGLVNSIAGSNSNESLAAMVFRNVAGTDADAGTVDMLVGFLDGRSARYTQADFMAVVAGLELNQTQIGLVGLQQTGIEYL